MTKCYLSWGNENKIHQKYLSRERTRNKNKIKLVQGFYNNYKLKLCRNYFGKCGVLGGIKKECYLEIVL